MDHNLQLIELTEGVNEFNFQVRCNVTRSLIADLIKMHPHGEP
jgi:hypothetical protein